MSSNEIVEEIALTITDNAIVALKGLLADEKEGTAVRVFVQGGGCSGFQYGFSFEENISPDDTVVEAGDVKVCVDPLSFPYLYRASVDYEQTMMSSQFVIKNPNATSTCGCGNSFNA